MADSLNPAERSDLMSRIRSRKNATTELRFVAALKGAAITGWRRHVQLKPKTAKEDVEAGSNLTRVSVRPDFIFRKGKVAIFIDGCFWHACPIHGRRPKSNSEYWQTKLERNVRRD